MEIRLEEIPEMNYFATDVDSEGRNCPRGEICFRAPSQFHRYYKDPEKTAETID
jgi:long-chain acyl-CoA synthetase